MRKLVGTLGVTTLASLSLLGTAGMAHAASPMPTSDENHTAIGCYVAWQENNYTGDTTAAQGFNGEWTHTDADVAPVTDPAMLADGYTKLLTVHNHIEMDAGLNEMNLTIQHMSSNVHTDDKSDIAFVGVTNTTPTKANQVLLNATQLNQANDPNQEGQITGITIPDKGEIDWDYTIASKSGDFSDSDRLGAHSGYMDGFLNLDSGGCKAVQLAPKQTHVDGPNNDTIASIPHTTVTSDSGWVDGKRTVVLTTDSSEWLFSDHSQKVYAAENRKALTGDEPLMRQATIVYTETGEPTVTVTKVPVTSTVTTMQKKTVTKPVTSTVIDTPSVLVQVDTYHKSFAAGTYDGKRKRTHAEKLSPALLKLEAALDDDHKLAPHEDRPLWGAASTKIVSVTAAEVQKYGSLVVAAEHVAGVDHIDENVITVNSHHDMIKMWVLDKNATVKNPFGAQHTLAQTDIDAATPLTHTVTKNVTTTVMVPVKSTVTTYKNVTTTNDPKAVDPVITYQSGNAAN